MAGVCAASSRSISDHIALPIELPKEQHGEEAAAELEWETVNRASALWTRPRTEVKDEEYQEFYKHVSHDFENPLSWSPTRLRASWNTAPCFMCRGVRRSICTSVKHRVA